MSRHRPEDEILPADTITLDNETFPLPPVESFTTGGPVGSSGSWVFPFWQTHTAQFDTASKKYGIQCRICLYLKYLTSKKISPFPFTCRSTAEAVAVDAVTTTVKLITCEKDPRNCLTTANVNKFNMHSHLARIHGIRQESELTASPFKNLMRSAGATMTGSFEKAHTAFLELMADAGLSFNIIENPYLYKII